MLVKPEKRLWHYLWHNGGDSRVAWVKWELCTMRKEEGGLGVCSPKLQSRKFVLKYIDGMI
eukprot:c34678_g1_i1 orf=47-229(+)